MDLEIRETMWWADQNTKRAYTGCEWPQKGGAPAWFWPTTYSILQSPRNRSTPQPLQYLGRSGNLILSGGGSLWPPPTQIFWSSYGPVTKSRSSSHANSPWYALTCNICEFGGSDVSNFDLMAQNIPLCRPNITHGLPIITALFGSNYPLSTYVYFKILYISV